jgi:hypothetical protein
MVSYGLAYLPDDRGDPLLVTATVVASLVAIAAGFTSRRLLREADAALSAEPPTGLRRFFGLAGLLSSGLFLLLILVEGAVALFLDKGL